jgi:hypothetical protein
MTSRGDQEHCYKYDLHVELLERKFQLILVVILGAKLSEIFLVYRHPHHVIRCCITLLTQTSLSCIPGISGCGSLLCHVMIC